MTTLTELTRAFARIGILSFGGPAAQIALMHHELVDEKQWVSEDEYLSALSFCMLLPGPEAMQLATWIGWRKHGTIGGLIAGGLFVLPGALIVLALSIIYAAWGTIPLVAALFTGVQAAVLAVVVEALLRVSKRALKSRAQWIIAALAFTALFAFAAPFPAVILAAGIWGFFTAKSNPTVAATCAAPWPETLRTAAIWGAVWLIPLALIMLLAPPILAEIALFFSKLALLTFGGAYAVLTWMAQDVVQQKQWLTLPQMIDGLGLAETTPGPLILVTEFVGYLAAVKHGHRHGPCWRPHHPLDDLYSLFPMDLCGRTVDCPPDPCPAPLAGPEIHHRRCRRRHRQPVVVVCRPCTLCQRGADSIWPATADQPRSQQPQTAPCHARAIGRLPAVAASLAASAVVGPLRDNFRCSCSILSRPPSL